MIKNVTSLALLLLNKPECLSTRSVNPAERAAMNSKLLTSLTLGLSFAVAIGFAANCKSEKKVVSQDPSDNLNPKSDPNDKSNGVIKGTQDEVLDYLKKVADEDSAKAARPSLRYQILRYFDDGNAVTARVIV